MNPMSSSFFLLPLVIFLTFQTHLIVAQKSNGTTDSTAIGTQKSNGTTNSTVIGTQKSNGTTISSLVAQVCQNSTHKDFCLSVFKSSLESQNVDLKGLLFIALKAAAKNATDTSAYIKRNLDEKSFEPAEEENLTDCEVNYADAVDQIDDAMVALSVDAYPDIDKWVKAAIADVDACEELVQGQSSKASEVSHSNHTLRLILNVALGVLHDLSDRK